MAAARSRARCRRTRRRQVHRRSDALGLEEDIFLSCFRLTNRALSRAKCMQVDQMYRGGKAAAAEKVPSCARSAQLVVVSAYSHEPVRAYEERACTARVAR